MAPTVGMMALTILGLVIDQDVSMISSNLKSKLRYRRKRRTLDVIQYMNFVIMLMIVGYLIRRIVCSGGQSIVVV